MNQLNVILPDLPYAVEEAMNRLRVNIKFCGKNTRKILLTSCQPNEEKEYDLHAVTSGKSFAGELVFQLWLVGCRPSYELL